MTRSVSRREVLKYALPAFAGLGTLAATVGAQKASAADMRLIDFAERLVQPEQIKAAGYDGALVYVSELRPGATFDFKPVTHEMRTGYARQVFKSSAAIREEYETALAVALPWGFRGHRDTV